MFLFDVEKLLRPVSQINIHNTIGSTMRMSVGIQMPSPLMTTRLPAFTPLRFDWGI